MSRKLFVIVVVFAWALAIISCTRSTNGAQPWQVAPDRGEGKPGSATVASPFSATRRAPGALILTPTQDPPHMLPTPRKDAVQYIVQPNDGLGMIAQRYSVSINSLIEANNILDPNLLEVGQVLEIPVPDPLPPGPGFKVIPDSELVYSPGTVDFDLPGFIQQKNGYLSHYREDLDGRSFTGAEVIARAAKENSVNPRLLLAILEYRSGWVSKANPAEESKDYPLLYVNPYRKGLYRQISFAANNLDRGYYLWRVNGLASLVLQDGSVVPMNPTINAGTAGVQEFFSLLLGLDDWRMAVGEQGVFATYNQLFGYPFDYAVEPLIPPGLQQPELQLPFEPDTIWSFTGGPHGGWADGSAWAALDFAPPGEALGCVQSDAWEVAVADGLIVRSDLAAVVLDLDGDGFEQTGWTILYMHVESRDRIPAGTFVHKGDPIGHPSCEGGVSTGTHLHIARRYNGEWISADGAIPFDLDGWISKGDGVLYNGYLVKNGSTVEAWSGRRTENQIKR